MKLQETVIVLDVNQDFKKVVTHKLVLDLNQESRKKIVTPKFPLLQIQELKLK